MMIEKKYITKCFYKKNLKMSPQKLSSQTAHAVMGLYCDNGIHTEKIVVLMASNKKFNEIQNSTKCFVQKDLGYTELDSGTETVLAFYERVS